MRASFPDGLSGTICRDRRTQLGGSFDADAFGLQVPIQETGRFLWWMIIARRRRWM